MSFYFLLNSFFSYLHIYIVVIYIIHTNLRYKCYSVAYFVVTLKHAYKIINISFYPIEKIPSDESVFNCVLIYCQLVVNLAVPSPQSPPGHPTSRHGSPDLDAKLFRLAPNGTNPGLFQIRFQYILARGAKMY